MGYANYLYISPIVTLKLTVLFQGCLPGVSIKLRFPRWPTGSAGLHMLTKRYNATCDWFVGW